MKRHRTLSLAIVGRSFAFKGTSTVRPAHRVKPNAGNPYTNTVRTYIDPLIHYEQMYFSSLLLTGAEGDPGLGNSHVSYLHQQRPSRCHHWSSTEQ